MQPVFSATAVRVDIYDGTGRAMSIMTDLLAEIDASETTKQTLVSTRKMLVAINTLLSIVNEAAA